MARFRALPYARALFDVVSQRAPGDLDAMVVELDRVAATFAATPELQRALVVPTITPEVKAAILDEVLDGLEVTDTMRRFVHVLQQHYRTQHVHDIAAAFREVVDRAAGRARARIETATVLDDDARAEIVAAMETLTGGTVIADFERNPDLLAGLRVRIGSKVFDGSLQAQLTRLSRETLIEQG